MSHEVKYCFEDEDVEHVAENMAELQVRRLPVLNRDKRLVGIVSLGDLATHGSLPKTARALHGISQSRAGWRACDGAKGGAGAPSAAFMLGL